MHNWFKDALLQKNGIVKVYWDEKVDVTKEKYQNLTQDEVAMLLNDPEVEVVNQKTTEIAPAGIDEMGMMIPPIFSYDVKLKKTKKTGKVIVENVPPEEFLISKKARTIADAPFVAHRRLATRSELTAMGFDKDIIENLPTYADLTYNQENVARFDQGEQPSDQASLDFSMQEIEVMEVYIKVDFDGDGIAELRKITYAGTEILDNEEADFVPFCSVCPIPMPHKFFGHSLADRAVDIQLIKSTVTRQILDNLYMTNSPRMGVVEGQVNLDDLLTVTANGIVRMKNTQAIIPLTVPATAGQSFPLLEYLDSVQAKRTGVSDQMNGLNPDVLQNSTATAVAMMQSSAAGKVELIARVFAETGVKDLFQKILQLLCKYQDKERIVRLRGKYVSIDPREWTNGFDISINVGLGTGNKQEQMAMIAMVLGKQEEILKTAGINNPLVSLSNYRQTLGRFIEAAGFKDSNEFFMEITPEQEQQMEMQGQQQPQQQDPAIEAYVAQMQAKMAADNAKAENDIQIAQVKAEAQIRLKQQEFEMTMALKKQEFEYEAQLKALQLGAKLSPTANIPNVI
jgi:predicted GNAT family acetyltransferase